MSYTRIVTPEEFAGAFKDPLNVVLSTFGPNGGNVLVAGDQGRTVFDDGLRAVENYVPSDPLSREATAYLLDAARAQMEAGRDGTSTTMILTAKMIEVGMEMRKKTGKNNVIAAFEESVKDVVRSLEAMSEANVTEEMLKHVATLSMHGNLELGNMVGGLAWRLGRHGSLSAVSKIGGEIEILEEEGFVWSGGALDEIMFNQGARFVSQEALVILANGEIENVESTMWKQVFAAYNAKCAQDSKTYGLILVCPKAAGSVAATFCDPRNVGWAILRCPQHIPSALFLSDLAAVTGATVIDNVRGSMDHRFTIEHVGKVNNLFAAKTYSVIRMSGEEKVRAASRIAEIEAYYDDLDMRDDRDAIETKKARLACLVGRVGEIRVPMRSQSDFKSLTEVLDDGFGAAKAALDGVVAGAGIALKDAGKGSAIESATAFPYNFIQPEFNASLAIAHGIIDPTKVVVGAVRNAWSVARQVLNTNMVLSIEQI